MQVRTCTGFTFLSLRHIGQMVSICNLALGAFTKCSLHTKSRKVRRATMFARDATNSAARVGQKLLRSGRLDNATLFFFFNTSNLRHVNREQTCEATCFRVDPILQAQLPCLPLPPHRKASACGMDLCEMHVLFGGEFCDGLTLTVYQSFVLFRDGSHIAG